MTQRSMLILTGIVLTIGCAVLFKYTVYRTSSMEITVYPYDKTYDYEFIQQRMLKDFPDDATLYSDIDSPSFTITLPVPIGSQQQVLDQLRAMEIPKTAILNEQTKPPVIIIKIDKQLIYVCRDQGKTIAFVRAFVFGTTGVIAYLSVAETYRSKGIGKKLLTYMVNILKQEGIHDITLSTGELNDAAVRLYKKVGFVESEIGNKSTPVFIYRK